MTTRPALKVEYALFCEEIRREDNGKLLALGIFGRDIRTGAFPVDLRLSVLVSVEVKNPVSTNFDIRIKFDSKVAVMVKGELSGEENGRALIASPQFNLLKISRPGMFSAQVRIGESRWRTYAQLPLIATERSVHILSGQSNS